MNILIKMFTENELQECSITFKKWIFFHLEEQNENEIIWIGLKEGFKNDDIRY